MECRFCRELREWVGICRRADAEAVAESAGSYRTIRTAGRRFGVALVTESVVNGESRGSVTAGRYDIIYCPQCGRRIGEGEIADAAGSGTRAVV